MVQKRLHPCASRYFQEILFGKILLFLTKESEQDGRLAPAYFSPNFKYFDQLLQTVKNKTLVLNLVFTNTDFRTL